jgi:hypothetical protein
MNENYCPRCQAKRSRQEYGYDGFACGAIWFNENDNNEFARRKEVHACSVERQITDCWFQWNTKYDIAEMTTSGS